MFPENISFWEYFLYTLIVISFVGVYIVNRRYLSLNEALKIIEENGLKLVDPVEVNNNHQAHSGKEYCLLSGELTISIIVSKSKKARYNREVEVVILGRLRPNQIYITQLGPKKAESEYRSLLWFDRIIPLNPNQTSKIFHVIESSIPITA